MMKYFYILIALLFLTASLSAHPLSNFSVNQYSRLEVEKTKIKIRQVLDVAEIPSFQLQSEIDADKDGKMSDAELNAYADKFTSGFLANLSLTVNNQPTEIRAESKNISTKPGEGNLPLLRIEWNLTSDLPDLADKNQVKFENKNFTERIGWNEIVLNRDSGVNIYNADAFGSYVTDELKVYPQESLNAPLAERSANFTFSTNAVPENAKLLRNRDGQSSAPVEKDRFAELINGEVTFSVMLFGLLLAFGFGAMHAMSPGHGKTVVGAYLVGSRGTPKHAVFLGLTVTITHTLGVFALGLITLFASKYILPEKLMPYLSFISGLMVLCIGLTMFKSRLFAVFGWKKAGHHHEHSDDEHLHDEHTSAVEHSHDDFTHTHDGHTHSHLPPEKVSWKNLLALGISGGLLPCPSALVLMLSAISSGRIGYGLILTLVFSFGLAATLTAVGLIFLYGGRLFDGTNLANNRIFKALPVMSAFVIACVGAIICYTSIA